MLVAGAQIYVNFISLTQRSGWLQAHISKRGRNKAVSHSEDLQIKREARSSLLASASRYLDFMELRELQPKSVPTRDISVCWSADLLRPTVGKIINHEELEERATGWYEHQQHRLLQSGARFEKATGRCVRKVKYNISGFDFDFAER